MQQALTVRQLTDKHTAANASCSLSCLSACASWGVAMLLRWLTCKKWCLEQALWCLHIYIATAHTWAFAEENRIHENSVLKCVCSTCKVAILAVCRQMCCHCWLRQWYARQACELSLLEAFSSSPHASEPPHSAPSPCTTPPGCLSSTRLVIF